MSHANIRDAYAISRCHVDRKMRELNVTQVGWKVGVTSSVLQERFEYSEPTYGYLTSEMAVLSGGTIPGGLIRPQAEAEVVFSFKRDLNCQNITEGDVWDAVDYVTAGIEVIDCRIEFPPFSILDHIADNAFAGRFVVSDEKREARDMRLAGLEMELRKNGKLAGSGFGADVLGDPIRSIVWLANTLRQTGQFIRTGQLVYSGSFGAGVPFGGGDRIEIEIPNLGKTSFSYDEQTTRIKSL